MFLFDNELYHQNETFKNYLKKINLPVIFSGPYSYKSASIERMFADLKVRELNKDGHPTGKKVSILHMIIFL